MKRLTEKDWKDKCEGYPWNVHPVKDIDDLPYYKKCVIYQSGGFTNYGISYRKYSQEELAEMGNRAVTENEKAINILKHMKNLITVRIFEEEALDRAIKALENETTSIILLEAAVEEIENLYGRDTELTIKIRDFLKA